MTKEEILNLNKEQYFVATINHIDLERIKDLQSFNFAIEEINESFENDVVVWQDEDWNDIIEKQTFTINAKLVHLSKLYKEWENWSSVQENLFIK